VQRAIPGRGQERVEWWSVRTEQAVQSSLEAGAESYVCKSVCRHVGV